MVRCRVKLLDFAVNQNHESCILLHYLAVPLLSWNFTEILAEVFLDRFHVRFSALHQHLSKLIQIYQFRKAPAFEARESWCWPVTSWLCGTWRGFFASLELAETWNKQFSLTSMDDAFKDAAGGSTPGDVAYPRLGVYLLYLGPK